MSVKINPYKNISLSIPNKREKNEVKIFPQISENTEKVIKGLVGMAVLGTAAVGIYNAKKIYDANKIKELNYIGQSIANHAVRSSQTRSKTAVDLYKKHIADKKLSVLKYKIKNGLLTGKSPDVKMQILNNLQKLEIDAI